MAANADVPTEAPSSQLLKPINIRLESGIAWLPVVSANVQFTLNGFITVCEELVRFPERTTKLILRCDFVPLGDQYVAAPQVEGYVTQKSLRRKFIPRHKSDGFLEQDCHFYQASCGNDHHSALILLLPLLDGTSFTLPHYHPAVAGIALRYTRVVDDGSATGSVQIDYLPLQSDNLSPDSDKPDYWPHDTRDYRTAVAFLKTIVKFGNSTLSGQEYVKRVNLDNILTKEAFQDLYIDMKERYSWIVPQWKEKTDPKKHVFEDVAIASFIILLWQQIYSYCGSSPTGGFVDVGCGNGLLVYILTKEGFSGYGTDIRARKSWALWGEGTDLRPTSLSPAEMCLADTPPFPTGSFLIGNHADELTPWLPLLAALTPQSAFINIPCCFHTLVDRFTPKEYKVPQDILNLPGVQADLQAYDDRTSENGGRYQSYMRYIAELTVRSGWRPVREALRIPSTKNWAFIGSQRIGNDEPATTSETRAWIARTAATSLPLWKLRKSQSSLT